MDTCFMLYIKTQNYIIYFVTQIIPALATGTSFRLAA